MTNTKLATRPKKHWTTADMPSQAGRSAVVTGTGGLGFEDSLALARAGGEVIIAGRSAEKGAEAVARIRGEVANANVRFEKLDLASLDSIEKFAVRLKAERNSVDLLINNAAVMVPPVRQVTADGFELQLGTNYLGHFALTAQLMPLLRRGSNPRVVHVSSVANREGQLNFDDLQEQKNYVAMRAYGQSKLACLMFAFELERRSAAASWGVSSIAAHPGISRTDLLHNAPGRWSVVGLVRSVLWFLFQPAAQGALPTLYAATDATAMGGAYYGPDQLNETRGYPSLSKIPPQACDSVAAARLWQVSEELTGVSF